MSETKPTSRGVKITAWVIAGLAAVSCVNLYNKPKIDPEVARIMKMQSELSAKAEDAHIEDLLGIKCTKDKNAVLGEPQKRTLKCGWGKPQKVNTTTTKYGDREQWVYGGNNYLYFTNGVLTSISN